MALILVSLTDADINWFRASIVVITCESVPLTIYWVNKKVGTNARLVVGLANSVLLAATMYPLTQAFTSFSNELLLLCVVIWILSLTLAAISGEAK